MGEWVGVREDGCARWSGGYFNRTNNKQTRGCVGFCVHGVARVTAYWVDDGWVGGLGGRERGWWVSKCARRVGVGGYGGWVGAWVREWETVGGRVGERVGAWDVRE